jgi:hypothetical protein
LTTSKSTKATDRSAQIERFREATRTIGADEDEAAFKAKLAVIARQKPKDEPKPHGARKPRPPKTV